MSEQNSLKNLKGLLNQLDGSGSDTEWEAIQTLRSTVKDQLPKLLLETYRSAQKWNVRGACVFYSIGSAERSAEAKALGLLALSDRSKQVRYRACMLLAIAQDKTLLPKMEEALGYIHESSREDLLAAMDAISNQIRDYFLDRSHTGRIKLNLRNLKEQ